MTDASSDELLDFAAPRTVAEVDLHSGESRLILDGAEPFGAQAGLARFMIAARDQIDAVAAGSTLDSTATLSFPSVDVDSEESYDVVIRFYIDEHLTVVITSDAAIPRQVVKDLALRIWNEVPDKPLEEMRGLGADARWTVVRALRGRVQHIEESVREALGDEHISREDYAALREYPARLARVERLVSTLDQPTWNPARRVFEGIDILWKTWWEVADEAREAVARLSGLISSQSVVVAQRQAAETERFQRLLTLVGTTVLVPGLVAAIFGANVDFPGRDTLDGFLAMLCFMVASAAASYAGLRSFQKERPGLADPAGSSSGRHLLAFAAVAIIAAVWGVVVLVWD